MRMPFIATSGSSTSRLTEGWTLKEHTKKTRAQPNPDQQMPYNVQENFY